MTNEIEHSGVVALGDGVTDDMVAAALDAFELTGHFATSDAIRVALTAALARPAQKPVAWRHMESRWGEFYWHYSTRLPHASDEPETWEPLYASPQPSHTTNCCKCGRIIDTREKKDGGDDFGAQLSDSRWTCSIECDDAVVDPDHSVSACVACEGKPCGENNPCAVCGRSSIAAPQPVHSQVAGTSGLLTDTAPSAQPPIGWVNVRVEDTGDGLIINPDDALKWRLRDDQAYEGHFLPDGTYRIAIPANAVSPAPADLVMVPQSAIDWLLGEGPDAAGSHFGDDIPERAPRYWWRSHFRELIAKNEVN